ncbi:MAG: amidophosphoribosyltransferase [Bacteroidetes bacterium HGW-Bacteroidetes-21]|nr:MAG: amidophosphoribosyltransferase [Bacteroidetes bacterium HGW-Bacteroidetes-21]
MSDAIKHECGFALIRLRKPLEYYRVNYGSWMYGINKLWLLMEKQHNRGQDGAGAVCLKMDLKPGKQYLQRYRSNKDSSIIDLFDMINKDITKAAEGNEERLSDPTWAKENVPFAGELYLGHLRYGTFGKNNIENVHPFLRSNNWKSRTLALAGNFNLTNVDELFEHLIELGQHPSEYSDTVSMLEKIGHFLDKEVERVFRQYKEAGIPNRDISKLVAENMDIKRVLNDACWRWDGGYAVSGITGTGDSFVLRDPWGIRPAFYYFDENVIVATSERPVLQTALNINIDQVFELKPGHALIARSDGRVSEELIIEPYIKRSCSFERIYFSRGTDRDIYLERKMLGRLLAPQVLEAIDYDIENTVISYIPNTAADSFYGLVDAINDYCNQLKKEKILALGPNPDEAELEKILKIKARFEKVAVKDVKMRTFISQDEGRKDLVSHVYDVTYGIVRDNIDTLVIVDDSIVRGTTLKESILRILDRLVPKKIVIVSSAPQIRYPDCYGIDMAKMNDFVAFHAAMDLLKERKMENVISEVWKISKEQQHLPKEEIVNYVKRIYEPFTAQEISDKVADLLRPKDLHADLKIIFNSIENLHTACPGHLGDWYFTGDYPTPGGNKVVNNAFLNFVEGKNERAY